MFKERGFTAQGLVLSREETVLFRDFEKRELDPEKMAPIVEAAEKYLEEDIPFLPLSLYRDFEITGNRSNFQRPYAKRRAMLFMLSLAEYYEGKGRFASKIYDLIWCLCEETTWVIPAHAVHNPVRPKPTVPSVYNDRELHGIDLFSAVTGAVLATTLKLNRALLDSLSPILAERIEYEIQSRIIKPFLSYRFSWSGEYGSKCNNWCPWITENVLYTMALTTDSMHEREAVVNRAMKYLDNYTSWLPDDGGCDEGPGYWGAAGGGLFSGCELISDLTNGKIEVFDHPQLKALGEYIVKFNINDNRFINFADCSSTMYPDGYLITRFGRRCHSTSLESFGLMVSPKCTELPNHNHAYKAIKNLLMPTPKNPEVPRAERFVWFPELKVFIARESEVTSEGMFLAIKGGHNGESHNHNDVGHFVIYHNGNPVIIDPGTVRYTKDTFGKNRYTIWAMQSESHNLPTFGGVGERQGREKCSTREVYDEAAHSVALGLEEAYNAAAGVVEYTRTACLDGAVVRIKEDIILDSEKEIDIRLITHVAPELREPGVVLLAEGRTLRYDPALEFSLDEIDPGDTTDFMPKWGPPVLFRIHLKTVAKKLKTEYSFT